MNANYPVVESVLIGTMELIQRMKMSEVFCHESHILHTILQKSLLHLLDKEAVRFEHSIFFTFNSPLFLVE